MAVGILGGGQLGLMLAESLRKLNADVVVLEPDVEAPCSVRLAGVLHRPLTDAAGLSELFSKVDVATYDSENMAADPLRPFAAKLIPSLDVLQVSQDRVKEKRFLSANGFSPVPFDVVPQGADVSAAIRSFGFPCIVKTVLGGYDGKGQYRLRSEADLSILPATPSGGWVLEEVLSLRHEVSCIVGRDKTGSTVAFPVFENVHTDHILDLTILPARVDQSWVDQARVRALSIAEKLNVEGLLTVELFIGSGRDGVEKLYVNELAPRVHNSGHVTRQACTFSQFDALARILSGTPLASPQLHPGGWCMGNLLGDVWLAQGRAGGALNLSAWRHFPEVVDVYLYGKREARSKRKMGHFVVHAATAELAAQKAIEFRKSLMRRD